MVGCTSKSGKKSFNIIPKIILNQEEEHEELTREREKKALDFSDQSRRYRDEENPQQ